jgi:hypothetical protein
VIDDISVALVNQCLNDFDHFIDVFGGPGVTVCRLDVQHLAGGLKRVDIKGRDFQRVLFFLASRLLKLVSAFIRIIQQMPDICDVHDMIDGISLKLQKPLEQVGHQERPKVTNVRVRINCRAATVQLNFARFNWFKCLDLF